VVRFVIILINFYVCMYVINVGRGATTTENVEGDQGLTPRARPEAGLGVSAGGGRSRCGGSGVSTPLNFS